MARKLNTPKTHPVTDQVINEIRIGIARNTNLTVNMSKSNLLYYVQDIDAIGTDVERVERLTNFVDLPPGLLVLLKSFVKGVFQHADFLGLVEPGTDTDDLSRRRAEGSPEIVKLVASGSATVT